MEGATVAILVGGSDLFSGLRGISKGTRIIEKAIKPFFTQVITVNYNYFLDFGRTHRKLVTEMLDNHRSSKIFLYGYSKGGDVVLQISRSLQHTHAIPLMVTIDIANGPWSAALNRSLPQNVKKNINVYQQTPRPPLYSYGQPTYSQYATEIENIDTTGKTIKGYRINHSNIEMAMVDEVIGWMKESNRSF